MNIRWLQRLHKSEVIESSGIKINGKTKDEMKFSRNSNAAIRHQRMIELNRRYTIN